MKESDRYAKDIRMPGNFYAFQYMDRIRADWGRTMDLIGMGPRQTPYRTVAAKAGMRLRAYGDDRSKGPVLLIVPAPIKRPYIWDLVPGRSVIQQCLHSGIRVYLIDWQPPGPAEKHLGLADYADRLILISLQAVETETGCADAILAAHSLGGTLGAIFAALHPEKVRGLILLGAPINFGKDVGVFGPLTARISTSAQTEREGCNVPGSFLSMTSWLAAPQTFGAAPLIDRFASSMDPAAMQTHNRVQRWTLDEQPLAGKFFRELVYDLYQQNRFMRAELILNGRRVKPQNIAAALLCVVDRDCSVVPPESTVPLLEVVSHIDKKIIWQQKDVGVSLQHVAPLVGKQAHTYIWPQIIDWIYNHWD